jgi:hypothetical protein
MRGFSARVPGWVVLLSLTLALLASTASAATKAERARAASEAVETALRCEVEGKNSERTRLLESALEQVPEFPPALWQTGHVQARNEWLKFDELPGLLADDQRLAEYRRRRDEAPNTAEGQLALAQWCLKQKLPEQARAHLTAVLEIDPNHAQARAMLGYRQVDGTWISEQEIQEAGIRAQQMALSLREWKPRIEQILSDLGEKSPKKRELATQRLLAIDDPAAIPAVEMVLALNSQETGLLAVRFLDKFPGGDAALALARQAVFSPWEPVRGAAAESLRKRDPVLYVPSLLSALTTPVQTRAELYQAPNGRLMYRHALYREGQETAELAVFETEYRRTLLWANDPQTYDLRKALLAGQRQADAAQKVQAIESIVAQQNALVQRLNERVCEVLAKATGENLPANPEAWWQWWNEYNGIFVNGAKPVKQAYYRESVAYEDPVDEMTYTNDGRTEAVTYRDTTIVRVREARLFSCLLAGTPVWTASGLTPIEQIRVGDLVLAQNPDTGELAYKPVLKTTERPPVRMLKIVFGDKSLQCDDGHPFWVPGEGWVKAGDLKEGTRLHAVEGAAEVRSVHATGEEELHNLVVADFHTYFVTEAKILTHDNTIREPTTALVPGLASR